MGNPRIDVIIPVYNGARFLEEAVRSAVEQTLAPARVLICDDGSTDETPVVAQRLARDFDCVDYLALPHQGVSATRNAGIEASDAPYLALLDADDIWYPEKLERQYAVFAAGDPRTGVVHTACCFIDMDGRLLSDRAPSIPHLKGDLFRPLLRGYGLTGSASSVLIDRKYITQVGLFDESMYYAEDWDYWVRLASACHFDYSPEALIAIRINSESASRQNRKYRGISFSKQELKLYEKWAHIANRDVGVVRMLRERIISNLLPGIADVWSVIKFSSFLVDWGERYDMRLFRGRIDLYSSILMALMRYIWWRTKKNLLGYGLPFNG